MQGVSARESDLPGLRPLDDEDEAELRRERARDHAPEPVEEPDAPLELAAAPEPTAPGTTRKFCRTCSSWRASRVCPVCHVDLDTGELVRAPTAADVGAPLGRDASGRLALVGAPTRTEWLKVALGQVTPSLPGAAVCFLLSWTALSFREIPLTADPFPWPGRLLAGFVGTVWLVERARAARTRSADLDFVEMGGVLLRAAFLFPLLAGMAAGHWVALPVAIVLAPVFPLLLGALVTETPLKELGPKDLIAAWGATEGYLRTMLAFTLTLGLAVLAIGWDEGPPLWRGVVAALGATVAGTLAGQARRSAEHVPDL